MPSRHFWGLVALVSVAPLLLAGVEASAPKVTFSCTGPGGLHIDGTGSELQVKEAAGALVVTVGLDNLTTGIGLRDTHMKEKYLETQKYPTAELSVPRSGLQFPAEGATVEATAEGTLTIHGTAKPVSVHYKASRKGSSVDVQGEVRINMNDYGITTPSYLGITVKPPVDISVTFRLLET